MPAPAPSASSARRFTFAFSPAYRLASMPFGVTPNRAWVQVDDEYFEARFGLWHVRTPLTNVVGTEATGPYQWFKTIGPAHLSFADHGLTFASNGDRGVCVCFAEPVRGIDPTGTLLHPGLTVTVADPEGLIRLLKRDSSAPSGATAKTSTRQPPVRSESERLADVQNALDNLHTMTAAELRDLADEHGITRTSSMSKADLVATLEEGLNADLLVELGEPDDLA